MFLYLKIYYTFFKIGLFGFGGGYSIISLIQHEMLENNWLSQAEFTDIIAISQITPGAIAINCSTYVGYVVTGNVLGAAIATIAVISPSLILMLIVCKIFNYLAKNKIFNSILFAMRPTIIGLILAAVFILINTDNFIDYKSFIIFGIGLLLLFFTKIHPIFLIILAGIIGLIVY